MYQMYKGVTYIITVVSAFFTRCDFIVMDPNWVKWKEQAEEDKLQSVYAVCE